ncbi:MAG TPA: hypothetical protein VHV30_06370 [Polyangiaceae bacterium]|nr:hypothetical protein [Polyangiaceae bacterium]
MSSGPSAGKKMVRKRRAGARASRRELPARRDPDAIFASSSRGPKMPFAFVFDAVADAGAYTKRFFGCTAIYLGEKIVFVLRDKADAVADNGVWIATTREHHEALRPELPSMRSIGVFGADRDTGWQVLPADDDGFEEQAMRACELALAGDPRIGKVPKKRRASTAPATRSGAPAARSSGPRARPARPEKGAKKKRR